MLTQENFKPVTLDERAFFERHYTQYPQTHSDNTFSNMVCWNHYAHYQYAYVEKNLIIASTIDNITRFRPPIGPRNPAYAPGLIWFRIGTILNMSIALQILQSFPAGITSLSDTR